MCSQSLQADTGQPGYHQSLATNRIKSNRRRVFQALQAETGQTASHHQSLAAGRITSNRRRVRRTRGPRLGHIHALAAGGIRQIYEQRLERYGDNDLATITHWLEAKVQRLIRGPVCPMERKTAVNAYRCST